LLDNSTRTTIYLNDNGTSPDLVKNDAIYAENHAMSTDNNQSDGNITLIANVSDNLGNDWDLITNVTLDNTAPNASLNINDNDGSTTSRIVTLTITFNDTIGVQDCRIANNDRDYDNWESCVTTKTWNLPANNGIKTVYVQVRDLAGNVNETSDDITLSVGAATTILRPLSNNIVRANITVEAIAPDTANSVIFKIENASNYSLAGILGITNDTSAADGWTQSWNTSNFSDGVYNVTAIAYDGGGNHIGNDTEFNITVDNTAATLSSMLPSSTQGARSFTVNVTADEEVSCRYSTTDVSYDNMGNTMTEFDETNDAHSSTTTVTSDGTYTIYFACQDTAGNAGTANTGSFSVVTAAATTIISPASNTTISGDTTITVIAPDDTNWMTFNISNSTGNYTTTGTPGITNDTNNLDGFTQNWQTANFADGLYNLSVHSYDATGNFLSTDNATSITIDNTAPTTVTFTTLPANLNVNVINLNWTPSTSTDVNYYNLYRSTNISFQISPGARIQNLSANITQDTVLDGTWYYKVTAVDTTGQESQPSNEVNVTVLTGGPTGQLFGTLNVNNSIVNNGANILLTFTGSSTDLNVTINTTEIQKLDNSSGALHLNDSGINGDFGADDGTYSAIFTISNLNNQSDGRKILTGKVNDSASNEFFPTLNITLDNTKPNATISILGTSPAGWTNVSTEYTTSQLTTLTLTFNDTFGINKCRLANEDLTFTTWETCTTIKAWILSENAGNKTVILEVKDNAENTIRTNDTIFLNATAAGLDLTPPNTPTVTDDGKYTNTKHKLHATWNTTDPQSEQLHIPLEYEYRISFNNLTQYM